MVCDVCVCVCFVCNWWMFALIVVCFVFCVCFLCVCVCGVCLVHLIVYVCGDCDCVWCVLCVCSVVCGVFFVCVLCECLCKCMCCVWVFCLCLWRVTLCGWVIYVCTPLYKLSEDLPTLCTGQPPTQCDDTRCCIIQFRPSDDEHHNARNM